MSRRHHLVEVLAHARVPVEEVVDTGQALKMTGRGDEEDRVARALFLQEACQFELGGDAGGALGTGSDGGHD